MQIVTAESFLNGKLSLDNFPARVRELIKKKINMLQSGELYTVVKLCDGIEKCQYGKDCPLYLEGSSEHVQLSEKCILEYEMAKNWFLQYLSEFDVKYENRSEISLLMSLVEIDIEIMRSNAAISKEGMEQTVVSEREDGRTVFDKKIHTLLSHVDNLHKRRDRVITKLHDFKKSLKNDSKNDYVDYIESLKLRTGGKN
jgi:hypothetical protein